MKKIYIAALLSIMSKVTVVYADAYSQMVFQNNCTKEVTFRTFIDNKDGINPFAKYVTVAPNSRVNLDTRIYNKNTLSDVISTFKGDYITPGGGANGAFAYTIENGWVENESKFFNLSNVSIYPASEYKWNRVSSENKDESPNLDWPWSPTIPTFTINACPINYDISDSLLKNIDNIYIFGDSLSDDGGDYSTFSLTAHTLPKSTPYYTGAFSNGAPWSEVFSSALENAHINVINYAVGGATTILWPDWTPIGMPLALEDEVIRYKLTAPSTGNNMAIIFIGGNDYLTAKPGTDIEKVTKDVVTEIARNIEILKNNNISEFVLIGLPDLSQTPEVRELGTGEMVKQLTESHNKYLKKLADDNGYYYIDTTAVFDMLINNTKEFNETFGTNIDPNKVHESCYSGGYTHNITEEGVTQRLSEKLGFSRDKIEGLLSNPELKQSILAYLGNNEICTDSEQRVFWDHVHPTAAVHSALAKYFSMKLGVVS